MSTEENPTPQVGPTTHVTAPISGSAGLDPAASWGAPPPATAGPIETPTQVEVRPHWPARKVIGAVVIAAVIVGGGTAAAIAATAPSTSTATSTPKTGSGTGGYHGRTPGSHGGYGTYSTLGNALHGDFVVRTNTGGYATERLQTGKVTSVNANSISLTSSDDYQSSYLVNSSTLINHGYTKIDQVHAGDEVTVVATLSGSTATAITLTDSSNATTTPSASGNAGPAPVPGDGMQPNEAPTGN